MPLPAFALLADLVDRWRPLSSAETALAGVLLGAASRLVRQAFPTVDARLAAGALDPDLVADVVAGVVKRAMLNADTAGVTAATDSVGPSSFSRTYDNPSGNLYLTAAERAMLAPPQRRVGTIRLGL